MTVLYLIVARGGSKRLPGKNLKEIQGISLVGYKCLAAKAAKTCTLAMISTDSPLIADIARQYGVTVPFIRPSELATDTATTEDVVRHAIAWCEDSGHRCDAIQLLEPSSPFVRPTDYDASVELMMRGKDIRFICGRVLYLFRWDYLQTRRDLYDYPVNQIDIVMSSAYEIDINTEEEFYRAERLAEEGHVDLSWAKCNEGLLS